MKCPICGCNNPLEENTFTLEIGTDGSGKISGTFQCDGCGIEFEIQDEPIEIKLPDSPKKIFCECDNCHMSYDANDIESTDYGLFCSSCINELSECDECGCEYFEGELEDGICVNCRENERGVRNHSFSFLF